MEPRMCIKNKKKKPKGCLQHMLNQIMVIYSNVVLNLFLFSVEDRKPFFLFRKLPPQAPKRAQHQRRQSLLLLGNLAVHCSKKLLKKYIILRLLLGFYDMRIKFLTSPLTWKKTKLKTQKNIDKWFPPLFFFLERDWILINQQKPNTKSNTKHTNS